MDIFETTEQIKEKFFEKGESGSQIEESYLQTYLNVVKKQENLSEKLTHLDFVIELHNAQKSQIQQEYLSYQDIADHMKRNLALVHFINENILKEVEKKEKDKKQKLSKQLEEMIKASNLEERMKIKSEIEWVFESDREESLGNILSFYSILGQEAYQKSLITRI